MSYPQKSVHPLEHQGTTQRERLLKTILPENLLLDDRNMADLLAFAGEYAKQIRYYNQDNYPDGDWTAFWERDTTALLAIVAATDLDQLQVKFRSAELDFVKACKKEKKKEGIPYCEKALVKLHTLVIQIYEVAILIENIYGKLPQNNPIRTEVGALIQGRLGITDKQGNKNFDKPLAQLISYHKGMSDDNQLIDQYQPLVANPGAWGLTVHDFLNCIDYRQITHKDQEELWRLFLDFFKVLTLIVSKAQKAFQLSVNGRADHPPHIALFLSFCLLFRRYHQTELNGMVGKHLNYYYRDVLRLQERREIPDRVHLVFEIAQDLESYRLPKDTLFLGGKDKNGDDLLYGLTDELILNKALLVEKQNLYFYKDENADLIPVALPFADRKDGFKELYPKGKKLWHSLWGAGLYKKLVAKSNVLSALMGKRAFRLPETMKFGEQQSRIIGKPGFLISSPELYLAKGGIRQISVNGLDTNIFRDFDVSISTKEKTENIPAYSEAIEFSLVVTSPVTVNEAASTVRHNLEGKLWIASDGKIAGFTTIKPVDDDTRHFLTLIEKLPFDSQGEDEIVFFTGTGSITNAALKIAELEIREKTVPLKVTFKTRRGEEIRSVETAAGAGNVGANGFEVMIETTAIKGTIKKTTNGNSLEFILPTSFPDIVPIANDPWVPAAFPFLRFTLKPGIDINTVSGRDFKEITVLTSNKNLKNLNIQLGDTIYTPTSEIPLIGTNTGDSRFSLYVIAPELSLKQLKNPVLSVPLPGEKEQRFTLKMNQESDGVFHRSEPENIDLTKLDLATPLAYSVTTPHAYFRKDIIVPSDGPDKPIIMFKIPSQSISVSYTSEPASIGLAGDGLVHKLYHIDYLGGYVEAREKVLVPNRVLPAYDAPIGPSQALNTETQTADGNLRLGLQDLLPGQTLSLLFNFAEGTGNPDRIAPDEMVWSYLRENKWIRIPPQFILNDETLGLRKTGIIRFQVPADINSGNTLAMGENGRKDLYWLQASATEDLAQNIGVDALPQLKDIFAQAGTAVFENNNNDLAHIDKGLPASSITQLRFRDAGISKVEQPFVSFDGLHAESSDQPAYYRRVHERLRHKNRAITVWDYERLTLENFPKVALVKCLPHTRDTDVRQPGYVTLGVVPYPANMTGETKFYPIFNAGDLEAIERFLNKLNTYFVSGQGGGVVCCCDSGCGCHDGGRLLVRNAIFEPVRLQVCVKFRPGKEELFYKKQLNGDLKAFLAPWAADDQTPLVFGTRIYTVELLRFLENLDYVDVVLGIKVKHFPNRETAENNETMIDFEEIETIEPFTSRSLLTTYLDILNEDNPNVLDHQILIAGQEGCEDCGC